MQIIDKFADLERDKWSEFVSSRSIIRATIDIAIGSPSLRRDLDLLASHTCGITFGHCGNPLHVAGDPRSIDEDRKYCNPDAPALTQEKMESVRSSVDDSALSLDMTNNGRIDIKYYDQFYNIKMLPPSLFSSTGCYTGCTRHFPHCIQAGSCSVRNFAAVLSYRHLQQYETASSLWNEVNRHPHSSFRSIYHFCAFCCHGCPFPSRFHWGDEEVFSSNYLAVLHRHKWNDHIVVNLQYFDSDSRQWTPASPEMIHDLGEHEYDEKKGRIANQRSFLERPCLDVPQQTAADFTASLQEDSGVVQFVRQVPSTLVQQVVNYERFMF